MYRTCMGACIMALGVCVMVLGAYNACSRLTPGKYLDEGFA
jgi:hypothetical protein